MGFNTNTHDRTIYISVYKPTEENIYTIRQVDDFALDCYNASIANDICNKRKGDIKLHGEPYKPFTYLGIITDFNGTHIEQSRDYIQISCPNYIDRMMISHRWNEENSKVPDRPSYPLPHDSLK